MAIKNDLSDLPKPAAAKGAGNPPVAEPMFAPALALAWQAEDDDYKHKPPPEFHFSSAGKCSRALGFAQIGVEGENGEWVPTVPKDPFDLPGVWSTTIGTKLHEMWQQALEDELLLIDREMDDWAEFESEKRLTIGLARGYADFVVKVPVSWAASPEITGRWADVAGKTVVVELKTTGGFSFKMKVGERGKAQGPGFDHVTQLALQVAAEGADIGVICYLATESISKGAAAKKKFSEVGRFSAEWWFTADELEPYSTNELKRIDAIWELFEHGSLARRMFPDPQVPAGAEIVDPKTGRYEVKTTDGKIIDTDTFWSCLYCSFQKVCATTASGRIEIPVELLEAKPDAVEET